MKIRDSKLDLIRTIAILSVLLCHSIEAYYYLFQDKLVLWKLISFKSKFFDIFCFTIGRLGVPLFLFLTGILCAKKTFSESKDIKKFYKKTYLPLLITFEIWIIIWNVFIYFLSKTGFEVPNICITDVLQNMILLKTVGFILPAWYVPMILGIYLFLPFISNALNKYSINDIKIPLVVGIIVSFVFPTLNVVNFFKFNFITDLDVLLTGGVFCTYLVVGKYIYDGLLNSIKFKYILFLQIISFILCVLMQFYCLNHLIYYKLWYDNFFLFCASLLLLEIIRRKVHFNNSTKKFEKVFKYFSCISFPTFLIHNMVQYLIYFYSSFMYKFNPFIRVIYMYTISLIITIIIIEILRKQKFLNKYLLRIKT